jgi:hypothetical protein
MLGAEYVIPIPAWIIWLVLGAGLLAVAATIVWAVFRASR